MTEIEDWRCALLCKMSRSDWVSSVCVCTLFIICRIATSDDILRLDFFLLVLTQSSPVVLAFFSNPRDYLVPSPIWSMAHWVFCIWENCIGTDKNSMVSHACRDNLSLDKKVYPNHSVRNWPKKTRFTIFQTYYIEEKMRVCGWFFHHCDQLGTSLLLRRLIEECQLLKMNGAQCAHQCCNNIRRKTNMHALTD